jgi:hypothetical protein
VEPPIALAATQIWVAWYAVGTWEGVGGVEATGGVTGVVASVGGEVERGVTDRY